MRNVSICLNLAVWLSFFIGAATAFIVSSWLLLPVLAYCILLGYCSHSIQRQSKAAAISGVVVMGFLTVSIFFPLGIVGLVSAYRDRTNWTAW